MKALVYDTDSGEIERVMTGRVPLGNQRLDDAEALLVDPGGRNPGKPETPSPVKFTEIPSDLTGKIVNPDTAAVVDDPEHEPPRTTAGIAQDLRDGDLSTEEALLEFLER